MTMKDYAAVLRRGWLCLVAGLLLGVGAALLSNTLLPREYRSDLTIYFVGQADGDYSVAAAEVALSRMPSYQRLVVEDRVLEDVVWRLKLPETPSELAQRIAVTNDPETLLLNIAVTDSDPQRAASIANSLAEAFVSMSSELDRPRVGEFGLVAPRIVANAKPPLEPRAPRQDMNLVLGAVVGLLLGAAAAFLQNRRGTRIKSVRQMRDVVRAPNLGTIATDSAFRVHPLLDPNNVTSDRWAEFRDLAENLQLVAFASRCKVVVLAGAHPAAGTTTTAYNLALALAADGQRVALVDADLRVSRIADLAGWGRTPGLTTVLSGRCALDEAMHHSNEGHRLDVLTTGALPPNPGDFLASEEMSLLVAELRRSYDVVLFDCSSLHTSTEAANLAAMVDGAVLVCRMRRTSSRESAAAAERLAVAGATLLGTVATFAHRGVGPARTERLEPEHRTQGVPSSADPTPRTGVNGSGVNGSGAETVELPASSPARVGRGVGGE